MTDPEVIKRYSLTKALFKYFENDLQDFINNPDEEMNLSDLFVAARELKGETQEQLAQNIGTDVATINEVETADLIVSFNELQTYFISFNLI